MSKFKLTTPFPSVPAQTLPFALAAFALTAALPQLARAQGQDARLEDTEIVVEKSRTNELPVQGRNFDKIPFSPPPPVKRTVRYDFPDFKLGDKPLTVVPKVAPIRQEAAAPVPGLYAELGFGNYTTPYARLGAHTKPSDDYHLGLDVRHQSSGTGPVDGKNSGGGDTRVGAEGTYFTKIAALGARLDYENQTTHFYGYDRSLKDAFAGKDGDIKQQFNRIGAEVNARSINPKSHFQYDLAGGFQQWSDNFKGKETNLIGRVNVAFAFNEHNRLAVRSDVSSINYQDSAKTERTYAKGTVAYEHDGERFDLSLGATAGYSSDTLFNDSKVNIYPAVRMAVELVNDRFVFFLGAGGGPERVTMYNLTREMPWLAPNQRLRDIDHQLSAYGGFTLTPVRAVRLLARGSYNLYRNLWFVNPSGRDTTRYVVSYQGFVKDARQTRNINAHVELVADATSRFQLSVKADYDTWDTDSLKFAWHRPNLRGSVTTSYNAADKVLISGEVYVVGQAYGLRGAGRLLTEGEKVDKSLYRQTDAVIDLNARVDYRFSPQLSFFAMGQNLLGKQYQQYLNYPVRGITVIGGLGYQF